MQSEKENYRNLFAKFYRTERALEFIKQYDKEQSWKTMMRKYNLRRIRNRAIWISSCAACISILISIAYYSFIYTSSTPTENSFADLQKIYPEKGGSKAILTLGNGTSIDLSTHQGTIAQSVKNMDGKELVYDKQNKEKVDFNTLTIPKGGEYKLILADGTKVWMNADSKIHYPVFFVGNTREVTLEGEAYFEVAHDEKHPFIVHTSLGNIQVFGTSFNVSAYKESPVIATLVSGSVAVSTKTSNIKLHPGKQAMLHSNGNINVHEVDVDMATSWRTGVYLFNNMPLKDIVAQLSRWYDVEIHFKSTNLEKIHFTGGIDRSEELAFAISTIADVSNVKFIREGDTIWIENK